MNDWDNMVKVALLGTHREPFLQEPGDTPLARLLDQLAASGPAHRLLSSAGTTDLYEQVGRSPVRVMRETAVLLAPADDRSPCSVQAEYFLSRMLSGQQRNLLPEFLTALQRSNLRVPNTLIPNLLTHGAKVVATRPTIIPLLSARDRQLASQNAAWAYASPEMESWAGLRRIWDDSPSNKRQSLVKQLRATTPDRGRDLLAATWKIDPDHQRIRMLKSLETGLSMNDEPFLETALDDRSQQIRLQAAELLAFLPESRLCQRMAKRVADFFAWTPEQELRISVSFPSIRPDMIRDGVVGSKSKSLARVRAQRFIQIVGAVPLNYWTDNWDGSPQRILQAVIASNWTRTLFSGLSWAAFRQRNDTWAKAILQTRGLEAATGKLVDLLSPEEYTRLIKGILAEDNLADPLEHRSPLLTALRRWAQPIDVKLAEILFPVFATHFRQDQEKKTPSSLVRSSFLNLAHICPPETVDIASTHLLPVAELSPKWRPIVSHFFHIMQFRKEMLKAVNNGAKKCQQS